MNANWKPQSDKYRDRPPVGAVLIIELWAGLLIAIASMWFLK